MFKKVLIANRGEIAVRIIRACKELGISTVAVYSDIDKEALHTQLADEAVCIGSYMAKDSYIKFIGPDYESIELMGNKSKAREVMKNADVPVVPGFEGIIENEEHALNIAKGIGYPVMIKASAGGGGKGIRIARDDEEFKKGYNTAKSEALACFGDDTLYIEKFIEKPKHIEFQVLADEHGNVIY